VFGKPIKKWNRLGRGQGAMSVPLEEALENQLTVLEGVLTDG
jgi:hypothetical protein